MLVAISALLGECRAIALRHWTRTTGAVSEWNPGIANMANGEVHALATDGKMVYAGGDFEEAGGVSRRHLMAVDAVTGVVSRGIRAPTIGLQDLILAETALYVAGSGRSGGQAGTMLRELMLRLGRFPLGILKQMDRCSRLLNSGARCSPEGFLSTSEA